MEVADRGILGQDDELRQRDAEPETDLNELKGSLIEWFRAPENEEYMERIRKLRDTPSRLRLIINLNHLRSSRAIDVPQLMRRPMPYMWAFREAAKDVALEEDPTFAKILKNTEIQVGFEGSFGHQLVSPRGLLCHFLCTLVCVEGIVTKCGAVRPKVVKSVHYCPKTKAFTQREYRDSTSQNLGLVINGQTQLPTPSAYPTKDQDNNPLETEFGLCTYKDHQSLTIQEMPERAPLGQMPRSVDVVLDNDLVDRVKPGDRVQVIGVYRALAGGDGASAQFRTVLLANNIATLGRDVGIVRVSPQDVINIREVSRKNDVLSLLGRSLAPSIYGHDHIKKALILQLLGGEEKNLETGTHLRGDINMLLVGDPSTAKSQLLRAVLHTAPLAINTTGRGSSGVGLTAAVTQDKDTGERRLEAGAMVLADRGIVLIDEFDKMSEIDRVAIHEVMEQQTVTINKAGIHASLNARCSVAAAANPVYGQYDSSKRPQENIGLPDSLLSRFDLLFVVLDQLNIKSDKAIAEHVIRGHRYRRPGADMTPDPLGGRPLGEETDSEDEEGDEQAQVYEKFNPLLHGGAYKAVNDGEEGDENGGTNSRGQDLLSQKFLRKYIHHAKKTVHPHLSDEAKEIIENAYLQLRAKQDARTLPVTPRCLETLIRLATAHTKARLSHTVEEVDAKAAADIMMYALYYIEDGVEKGGEEDELHADTDTEAGTSDSESGKKRSRNTPEDEDEEEEEESSGLRRSTRARTGAADSSKDTDTDSKFTKVQGAVIKLQSSTEGDVTVTQLMGLLEGMSREEVLEHLQTLDEDDKIMLREDKETISVV